MHVGLKIQGIRGRYARRDINTVIAEDGVDGNYGRDMRISG